MGNILDLNIKKISIPEAIEMARKKSKITKWIKERETLDKKRIEKYKDKSLKDLDVGDEVSLANKEIVIITGIIKKEILIEGFDDSDAHGINIIDLRFCRFDGYNKNDIEESQWYNSDYSRIDVLSKKSIENLYIKFLKQEAYSILQEGINLPADNKKNIIEYIYWLLPFAKESKGRGDFWYIGE